MSKPQIRLRELRQERHLSQTELARRLGFTRQYISLIEMGRRLPGLSTLSRLTSYFDCGLDDLVVIEGNKRGQG